MASRFTAPGRSAGFWVAMWTLAVAAEFGALVPIIFAATRPSSGADVVYRLVGGSFAAFGLVAWHRRPDSRSGPLMTATGFGLLVSLLLKQIHAGVALTAGEVLEDIWAPVLRRAGALVRHRRAAGVPGRPADRRRGRSSPCSSSTSFSMLFVEQPGNVLLVVPERDDLRRRRHHAALAAHRALRSRPAS